jgi:hypothetical protein
MATLAIAAVLPAAVVAQPRVHRFALVIGANLGGAERPRLQYAVTDAERFAQVLVELGGVTAADAIVLRQPKLQEVINALDRISSRVAEARRTPGGGRTEVLLYYSGHADEQGLLLGEDRYSYRTLRDRLDQIPADVRIAVLDACASGAFTRIKSGHPRPAFLVDEAANMRGHAFLTSSAETEAAQESDRIRASYFTHYLVSGFRGAADLSGDGKVTLNEAYQFAFNETLGRTVDTRGGAQHPSYDISLSGTGDVVMTDIRQTSATLVLGEDLDGRFFVRNARNELIVELYKPRGRRVELGVEPGVYEVRMEIQKRSLVAKTEVPDGGHFLLDAGQFGPVAVEATRRRGGQEGPRLAVDGRNRLALRFGMWRTAYGGDVSVGVSDMNTFGALEFQRYVREDLSIAIGVQGLGGVVGTATGPTGVFAGVADVFAMPISARWFPMAKGRENQAAKPFVAASLGPVFGSSSGAFAGGGTEIVGSHSQTTVGGHIGGGVDFHVARSFALGVNAGYNWMVPFEQPVGARSSYDGAEVGLTIGWLFGKGRHH